MTADLADTLTHQIQSKDPGDNSNATVFYGDVFITETYFNVRWPWLIMPLAEALLAAILLIISILLTRGEPLLKSSVLALLVHGLDGWTDDELEVEQPETGEKLEHLGKGMTARLGPDVNGRVKFVRS